MQLTTRKWKPWQRAFNLKNNKYYFNVIAIIYKIRLISPCWEDALQTQRFLHLLPALNDVSAINVSANCFGSSHILLWNRRNLNLQNDWAGCSLSICNEMNSWNECLIGLRLWLIYYLQGEEMKNACMKQNKGVQEKAKCITGHL